MWNMEICIVVTHKATAQQFFQKKRGAAVSLQTKDWGSGK